MKKLISSEIGANYTQDDGKVALTSLLSKTRVSESSVTALFNEKAGINPHSSYLLDSGRSGISLILDSLDLKEDNEILLQSFSCVVVPNSTHKIGAKIKILDVSESTFTPTSKIVEQAITTKTKVLIWQYNFGITQDMSKIIELCKQFNITLIEDCAHAIGQTMKVNGVEKKIGTIGDAAIFSFGRDKVISCTQGGMLVVNNASIAPEIRDLVAKLETQPLRDAKRHLRYAVAFPYIIRPHYHKGFGKRFKIGPIVLKIGKLLRLWNPVYSKSEKKGSTKPTPTKLNPILFKLIQHQLHKLDLYQGHRQAIQGIYASRFNQWKQDQPLLRFPLDLQRLIETQYPQLEEQFKKNRKKIQNKIVLNLEKDGFILVSNWYTSIFAPAPKNAFGYKKGQCITAEELIKNRIINLPTNIHVSQQDARMIVDSIEKSLQELNGGK